jgi:hypothetical protein
MKQNTKPGLHVTLERVDDETLISKSPVVSEHFYFSPLKGRRRISNSTKAANIVFAKGLLHIQRTVRERQQVTPKRRNTYIILRCTDPESHHLQTTAERT